VSNESNDGAKRGQFPLTRWSVVVQAQADDAGAEKALSELCETYWFPLYVYARRVGNSPADAEDLTQAFFAKLIEKGYIGQVDRERGKLRTFLLTSMKNFLSDEWDKTQALKRGGGHSFIAIDQVDAEQRYALEPRDEESPDRMFEKRWALTLLENIVNELREEFEASGKGEIFAALQSFLAWNSADESYKEAAEKVGISENAARVTVFRMRKRFGELMRRNIADTVATEAEVETELNYLMEVIAR